MTYDLNKSITRESGKESAALDLEFHRKSVWKIRDHDTFAAALCSGDRYHTGPIPASIYPDVHEFQYQTSEQIWKNQCLMLAGVSF
jgi:hypothetical protein